MRRSKSESVSEDDERSPSPGAKFAFGEEARMGKGKPKE